MHGLEDNIVQTVTSAYATLGYAGVLVLMALESCCIPIPSEIILPLAGFLVGQGRFNFWIAVLAGTVGGTLGSSVAYAVGYYGGRPLVLRYGKYVLINREDAERADRFFARYGDVTAFISRLLPVIRTFISLPAGITRMHTLKFVAYTFAGSLIWSVVLVYVGQLLGQNWIEVRAFLQRFDYLIVLIVLVLIAFYVYRHMAAGPARLRRATKELK